MVNGEAQRAAERLLNDESLIANLKDDEAKALIDWSLGELRSDDDSLDTREARVREAMREINELVGHRQSLVSDDLEERMAKLLVNDLDPKSQVRLSIEREIAQVTAEKDHIAGFELVKRLTDIASKTWRMKQQGTLEVESSAEVGAPSTSERATPSATREAATRARPIPRPTPIPPQKAGLLARLLGRK